MTSLISSVRAGMNRTCCLHALLLAEQRTVHCDLIQFNTVVCYLPCLKKERGRRGVLVFFSNAHSQMDDLTFFLNVEYPRKVSQVRTLKQVKNHHVPSLTFMFPSKMQGFILPQVLAWLTPWILLLFPLAHIPLSCSLSHSQGELAHPTSLTAETVLRRLGITSRCFSFFPPSWNNHPFTQQQFSSLHSASFGVSCAWNQVEPGDWQGNSQHCDILFPHGLISFSFVAN